MAGWYAVKRGITSHPLFKGKPDRLAVWMWLMDNVAWKDTTHDVKGHIVPVPRGSVCASERHIAAECGVGYQVVRTAIKRFATEHMLNTKSTHGKNLITLCNYEKYQDVQQLANATPTQPQRNPNAQKEQGNKVTISPPIGGDGQVVDFEKEVFDRAVAFLGRHGTQERQARSFVGLLRKDFEARDIFDAFTAAGKAGVTDPIPWVRARLGKKSEPFKAIFDPSKFEDQA